MKKIKKIDELEKNKEGLNHKNTKMTEIKSELDKKKKDINYLKNNIKDLKNKNLLINKYKQEILELRKQLSENEKYFNDEEKNRIEKNKEINRYKQEIQELKEKLGYKDDASQIKSNSDEIYDDMPYLETEEDAAEKIADFYEKEGKGYVDLPILLSKSNINSSKELIGNVKQLVKNLYDNKQITK